MRSAPTSSRPLPSSLIAAASLFFFLAGGVAAQDSGQAPAQPDRPKVIRVASAVELVKALGPDRIVSLAPGRYDLTGLDAVKNRYVRWLNLYDGPCPVVKGVTNLALFGEIGPGGGAEIVISPSYGWVLSFEASSGVKLSGLVLGHTKPGYCEGGVLGFEDCEDIEIRSCELYGSGTYGLGLAGCENLTVADSKIHDCTFGLAAIEGCEDLLFDSTVFARTGEFDLVEIRASARILFRNCDFSDNRGESLFAVDEASRDLQAASCRFLYNDVASFSSGGGRIELEGATIYRNAFPAPD